MTQNRSNQNTAPQPDEPVVLEATYREVGDEQIKSLRTLTIVVYVLQAVSFFTAITGLIGLIINYVKRAETQGTWLASHFRWQIRTFWFALLWTVIGLLLVYFIVGFIVLFFNMVWVIYRIVRGLLSVLDNKPMYP